MLCKKFGRLGFICLVFLFATAAALAQDGISPPRFGSYTVGDDYFLASYAQLVEYWTRLSKESNRIRLTEIGKTSENRPIWMAIITSPENHARLEHYKSISRQLAQVGDLTDERARALAAEGRTVVWIDGGLHATEVTGSQHLFAMAYQMASRSDPETLRILNDVILLLVPANPDGMDLVANWYMRQEDPARRTTDDLPVLYHKYVGHDNNRDFYLNSQAETEAISRQHYIEWLPQIIYNQHQVGPVGVMLFAPPFRDPFNYNQDPLVPISIDLVGAAMHSRFLLEGKAGAISRNGANFSTWFNGGLRTTTGFHNQIGLLTEMRGHPTPIEIPLVPEKQLPSEELPMPIAPQKWHFRQSLEYSVSADRAILDLASRCRENFLFNIYRMGKNSIERGSRDTWTVTPRRIAAMKAAWQKDNPGRSRTGTGGPGSATIPSKYYEVLRDPAFRDPRGYILPSSQPDFLTATRFVNALIKSGITVHRATGPFSVGTRFYPQGSYVIKAAQPFRPHLRDMFEPQDHPDDIPCPGGPPTPPYDAAGYTLAFQMGVQFDRILDEFPGPFEKIEGLAEPPPGRVAEAKIISGYLLDRQWNDSFTATTRLLEAGEEVYWLKTPVSMSGKSYPAGTIYIPSKEATRERLQKTAAALGVNFDVAPIRPKGDVFRLRPVKIGLADQYGGSMSSGWIRWMLEKQFPCPFEVVYPPALDEGNLIARFDVLILPDGMVRERGRGAREGERAAVNPESLPPEYRSRLGRITVEKTVPQLRKFVEDGGTILAIGSSARIGALLGLPVRDHLAERAPDGEDKRLPTEKFYVPGSILTADVDLTHPLAYGLPGKVDFFFQDSPVFRLGPETLQKGLIPVSWYSTAEPLRSGWAWGQNYLEGGTAVLEANLGRGKVLLFGPQITFRAQPHGTFKFLFNGIYYGKALNLRL